MRKLIVSMNVTLDGFLSGQACELDWHFESWTSDMADALCMRLATADTILLGRVTYAAMAGYWQSKAMDLSCSREDLAFVDMMNHYNKIVVSKTLTKATWSNSDILNGNLEEELSQLKQQSGKDIIIYGSGKLLSALVPADLIDEYQLWIHPVAIRKGKPLFGSLLHARPLKLINAETFSSGIVVLTYSTRL